MMRKKNVKEDFPRILEEVDRKARREVEQSNMRFLKKKFEMKRESTLLQSNSRNNSPLAKIKQYRTNIIKGKNPEADDLLEASTLTLKNLETTHETPLDYNTS